MRYSKVFILLLGILFSLLVACEKLSDHEKFQRPDYLPGKLYTTVLAQENLSLFAECLRLVGLDTILDVSGSWSVFAPTNEAMDQYLSENQYPTISDIPLDKLERITEFHVVQNPWTHKQLQDLAYDGWRTGDDENLYSYAYKRETISRNPDEKYWIRRAKNGEMIVIDSTISHAYKMVYVESRKYVPIFYDEYISLNDITSEDFSFYFDRPYEPGNVYFAGAKILQADIFAENGFVHTVDKVVNPMLNAQEQLERETPFESYKLFLKMVYWYYPTFRYNKDATENQWEVRVGGQVDSLWALNYYDLAFDLQREKSVRGFEDPSTNETLVRHNGMYAPIDDAFREFIDGILTVQSGFPHWPDYRSLPRDIHEIIFARHFKSFPIYPSTNSYQEIFREEGKFQQFEGDIIRKEFGSNCTFIGLSSYIPDRVFTSVTGPVFLRPDYSIFRRAMVYSRIEDEIAYNNDEMCFFPIPDYALYQDSSFMLNWIDVDEDRYNFTEYNMYMEQFVSLSRSAIRNRIRNHVGTSLPNGSANKEFIPTRGGNYIIWNNSDNTVQGTQPCTEDFRGNIVTTCYPGSLNEPADNGKAWSVNYWFNFENPNMRDVLSGYPEFFDLLIKAGIFYRNSSTSPILDRNKKYTVFVPSEEALIGYRADTLDTEELGEVLKNHFLQDEMIFTDNKQASGNYYTEGRATLNIRTSPDIIEILDKTGNPYVLIPENEHSTNMMASEGSEVSSVVHEIDKVLIDL